MGYRNRVVVGLVAIAVAACSEPASPPSLQPQAGVLQLEVHASAQESQADPGVVWTVAPGTNTLMPPSVLTVPAEVQAGQPFTAVVTTLGTNGCWRAETQSVSTSGRVVELKPYDIHSGADFCTEALVYLDHASSLTLNATGEWTVRVTGRRARHGDAEWETPVSAEKTIIVR